MKEIIYLILLVILQNASFTLVSRARNSKSIMYHMLAAFGSNGIWLFVFEHMTVNIHDWVTKLVYLFSSVAGSLLMHYIAMRFFEKPKKPVKQVPTVGRIVNFYDTVGVSENSLIRTNAYKPAIIVAVHTDTCIDVVVFDHYAYNNQDAVAFRKVIEGYGLGEWSWPEIKK